MSPNDPPEPDDLQRLIQEFLGSAGAPGMADALKSLGIDRLDESALTALAGQLSALFSAPPTDGINLELCTDLARKTVAAAGDARVDEPAERAVREAVGVADLWLAEVTQLRLAGVTPLAWSRAEWVEETMPVWGRLVGPVARAVNSAITGTLRGQLGALSEEAGSPDSPLPALPGMPLGPGGMPDMGAMFAQMEPMLERMSSSMFGAQIGQAVGNLAGEVVSGTEVGLPLLPAGQVALLPSNVADFASGLAVDDAQVLLYLAVREVARARLFAAVPWVGPQVLAAVEAYAADISIDTDGIEAKLATIDAMDPQAVQEALAGGLFTPEPSPAQRRALQRLETWLALIEGWVDVVTERATGAHLPHAAALGEAVRRRRATGGPAEQLFAQLVGLQLRPRRLRDAANLFAALENRGGAALRDSAWGHPDVAPSAADLDDILGYVERLGGPRRPVDSAAAEATPEAAGDRTGTAGAAEDAGAAAEDAAASGGAEGEGPASRQRPEAVDRRDLDERDLDERDLDDMDAALARLLEEETGGERGSAS